MALTKHKRRIRIKNRIRKIVSGTEARPRLSVFRSNNEIYAQIVDDVSGKTISAASSRDKDINTAKVKIATRLIVQSLLLLVNMVFLSYVMFRI